MFDLKKYSTLLLDADETLLDFEKAEAYSIKQTCEKFSIPFSSERAELYSSINQALWKRHEKGEVTKAEIKLNRFVQFAKAVDSSADPREMGSFYEATLSTCGELLDGAAEFCAELSRHYKLYIVTNGLATVQRPRLNASGLLPFFEKVFISEEYGSQKPEKLFFDKIFKEIPEKDKGRICIIGDSMSSDILGGINAGIDTCFFNPKNRPETLTPTYKAESFKDMLKIFVP